MLKLELKIGNKKMGLSENDCNYWSMWTIIAPRKVPAWHFPNLICGLSAANLLHHQTHKFLFIVLTKIAIRNYQTPSKHESPELSPHIIFTYCDCNLFNDRKLWHPKIEYETFKSKIDV